MKEDNKVLPVILLTIVAIFAIGLLYFFRTWFHGLAMIPVILPWLPQVFVLGLIIGFIAYRKEVTGALITAGVIFLILLIPAGIFSAAFRGEAIYNQTEYNIIEQLPENTESIRLMPLDIARRYARDSLQLSQYKLGTPNISLIEDELSWHYPLIPDGFIIGFRLPVMGLSYVDATTQERNSQMVQQDFTIGQGLRMTRNLYWNLFRERYFVNTEDPYYVVHNEEIYTIVPAIEYKLGFKFPFFYSTPHFAGSFVVEAPNKVSFLSHEELLEAEFLKGNIVYPEVLTRVKVNAHRYNLGIVNNWFIHENKIDLQDVSTSNRQPFLMETVDGLKWFLSAEPHSASHGVFKIFIVDARTGVIEMKELSHEQSLTGPVRAIDYVRRSNPIVDWERFTLVEPLPFIKDGVLYWKITVVPTDGAGIAYQAFLDSRNNQVIEFLTDDDIRNFITRGEIPDTDIHEGEKEAPLIEEVIELLKQAEQLLERMSIE